MFISSVQVPPNSYELRLYLTPADDESQRPYVASAVICVLGEEAELRLLTASKKVNWLAAERALLNWCRGMGVTRLHAQRLLGRRLHWPEIASGRFIRDVPKLEDVEHESSADFDHLRRRAGGCDEPDPEQGVR